MLEVCTKDEQIFRFLGNDEIKPLRKTNDANIFLLN